MSYWKGCSSAQAKTYISKRSSSKSQSKKTSLKQNKHFIWITQTSSENTNFVTYPQQRIVNGQGDRKWQTFQGIAVLWTGCKGIWRSHSCSSCPGIVRIGYSKIYYYTREVINKVLSLRPIIYLFTSFTGSLTVASLFEPVKDVNR